MDEGYLGKGKDEMEGGQGEDGGGEHCGWKKVVRWRRRVGGELWPNAIFRPSSLDLHQPLPSIAAVPAEPVEPTEAHQVREHVK